MCKLPCPRDTVVRKQHAVPELRAPPPRTPLARSSGTACPPRAPPPWTETLRTAVPELRRVHTRGIQSRVCEGARGSTQDRNSSFLGGWERASQERRRRSAGREARGSQSPDGSLVGTKKLLLFNKRKEETAHFQSVVSNLEFGDLAGLAVPTTQDRNTRDPGLPVRRLGRWTRSSGTARGCTLEASCLAIGKVRMDAEGARIRASKKCPKSRFWPIGFFSSSLRSELLD